MRSKCFASCFVLASMVTLGMAAADEYTGESTPVSEEYLPTNNVASVSPNLECKKRRSQGFYLLAGVGGLFTENNAKSNVKYSYEAEDDEEGLLDFEESLVPLLKEDGFVDIDVSNADAGDNEDDEEVLAFDMYRRLRLSNEHKTHLSGVVGVGYGRLFDNGFYAAIETLLDFGSTSKITKTLGEDLKCTLSNSGLIPSAAIRLGYKVSDWHDLLLYVKGGGAYISGSAQFSGSNEKIKVSKLVPIVAAGVDLAVNSSVSVRLEGEYRFESKKSGSIVCSDMSYDDDDDAGFVLSRVADHKQKTKSYAVRLIVSWCI
ncbi:MAG: porin family protein [Holosporaceae bacterium]|jgi:opacity protein-like surface antigen|nr:porin family protein [Holosporaceae bacterium]